MSLFSHHSIVVYTFPALAAKCYLIILFITLMEHSYGTVFPSKVIFHVDVDSNLTKLWIKHTLLFTWLLSLLLQTKANDNADLEEGYDSSKDEVSSVSSYNPSKANPEFSLRNSLSMQSLSSRLSTSEPFYHQQVERPNFPSYSPVPRLSVSEISDDHDGGKYLKLIVRYLDLSFLRILVLKRTYHVHNMILVFSKILSPSGVLGLPEK